MRAPGPPRLSPLSLLSLLLALLALLARAGAFAPCAPLAALLPPARPSNAPGSICGGHCCSSEDETLLKTLGSRDLQNLLHHHAMSLHELFATTATALQSHVLDLARQSENKTLYLFHQVYSKMSVFSKKPIGALYSDVRNYVSNISDVAGSTDLNIENSVTNFFTDLFPLVYHHAVTHSNKLDFTKEYKVCLIRSVKEIQPFGDIPRQISNSMYKSLEATRVLLQALSLGSEVLNTTDNLFSENERTSSAPNTCHTALLKMSYCYKCLGLGIRIKPCSGYCLNVLRGCLSQHVSELDLPWNGFVEAVERLVIAVKSHDKNVDADTVLRGLDTRISEAIMYAMENGPTLEKKVKRQCGHAQFFGEESVKSSMEEVPDVPPGKPRRIPSAPTLLSVSPLDTQMLHFLASVAKSKGFFLNLADTLCRDESLAEQSEGSECWNGERVGEYTKAVVGSGMSLQKYNPEVEISTKNPTLDSRDSDNRVVKLSHRLKNMRQLVMQQISTYPVPVSESFMQGDMAKGDRWDGSGSGTNGDAYEEPDDPDSNWAEGSGSGYDEYEEHTKTPTVTNNPDNEGSPKVVTASSSTILEFYYCTLFSIVFSLIVNLSARNYMRLL